MLISNNIRNRKSITNLKDPSTNKLACKRNEVANILNIINTLQLSVKNYLVAIQIQTHNLLNFYVISM